jgi:general secretion pathway protein K
MKRRRYTNERGIALISTVYITLFLALLAATLSITARSQAVLLRSNADRLMARELAMAAIDLGIGDVIRPKSDRRIPRDGRIVSLSLATGQASIAIQDESGKLDLNAAPIETLKPLFINIGKEAGLDAFAASTIAEKLASIEPVKGETMGERGRLHSVAELRIIPADRAACDCLFATGAHQSHDSDARGAFEPAWHGSRLGRASDRRAGSR